MMVFVFLALVAVTHAGVYTRPDSHAALSPASAASFESGESSVYRTEDLIGNYNFGYEEAHTSGGSSRQESGDAFGNKAGSYSLHDADGRARVVTYAADSTGFRAHVSTNEPGTAQSTPAAVGYNAPVVIPADTVETTPAVPNAAVPTIIPDVPTSTAIGHHFGYPSARPVQSQAYGPTVAEFGTAESHKAYGVPHDVDEHGRVTGQYGFYAGHDIYASALKHAKQLPYAAPVGAANGNGHAGRYEAYAIPDVHGSAFSNGVHVVYAAPVNYNNGIGHGDKHHGYYAGRYIRGSAISPGGHTAYAAVVGDNKKNGYVDQHHGAYAGSNVHGYTVSHGEHTEYPDLVGDTNGRDHSGDHHGAYFGPYAHGGTIIYAGHPAFVGIGNENGHADRHLETYISHGIEGKGEGNGAGAIIVYTIPTHVANGNGHASAHYADYVFPDVQKGVVEHVHGGYSVGNGGYDRHVLHAH